jgi:nicotinamidase/pyrazinamidase
MSKAAIAVDVENDFSDPNGSLSVTDGQAVIEPLIQLFEDAEVIVLTRDWHPANHFSFSPVPEYRDGSWPDHGVEGTWGADIDARLFAAALNTGKIVLLVHKGTNKDKEAYSAFDGEVVNVFNSTEVQRVDLVGNTLARALKLLGITELVIGGLALDYCVKATAIDGTGYGPTTLVLDATRPVAYLTGAEAVRDLAAKGVRLV